MASRTVTANGLEFGLLEDGPADGPLALCLHGFPDTAHAWRFLLPALADAGFHAVAPFMRGYAPTGVPADGDYSLGVLVADAAALHEALGGDERAVIVGHDWGAATAFLAGAFTPDRWRRVVGMAVPPLPAGLRLFTSYDQLKRFFYFFFFRTPLAEAVVAADDMDFLARLWAEWSPGLRRRRGPRAGEGGAARAREPHRGDLLLPRRRPRQHGAAAGDRLPAASAVPARRPGRLHRRRARPRHRRLPQRGVPDGRRLRHRALLQLEKRQR